MGGNPSKPNDPAPVQAGSGRVFIALGTNLPFGGLAGPALLSQALDRIVAAGVKVLARSSFWESPFWPPALHDQAPVVNAVAEVDPGDLDASGLYRLLAETEVAFGRQRRERWGARTLDLDIVDFRGQTCEGEGLTLPHPRAHERAFVLAPLAEIAPAWRHPVFARTAGELLGGLEVEQGLTRIGAPADR
jgi:2-amino-4-hydroxy-6-hydroxymethyldihydropteridine diphosphokinase